MLQSDVLAIYLVEFPSVFQVVDYNFLLNVLQDALSLYQDMEISIMTYTSDGLETSVVTELNFTTIDGEYFCYNNNRIVTRIKIVSYTFVVILMHLNENISSFILKSFDAVIAVANVSIK